MTITQKITDNILPKKVQELIEVSLKKDANLKCEVVIVAKANGEKSRTDLVITINSQANYDEFIINETK